MTFSTVVLSILFKDPMLAYNNERVMSEQDGNTSGTCILNTS